MTTSKTRKHATEFKEEALRLASKVGITRTALELERYH